jgi:hypothetical protein
MKFGISITLWATLHTRKVWITFQKRKEWLIVEFYFFPPFFYCSAKSNPSGLLFITVNVQISWPYHEIRQYYRSGDMDWIGLYQRSQPSLYSPYWLWCSAEYVLIFPNVEIKNIHTILSVFWRDLTWPNSNNIKKSLEKKKKTFRMSCFFLFGNDVIRNSF